MVKNNALFTGLAVLIGYWLLTFFVPSEVLRQIFTGIALGIASVIIFTWAPAAWRAFKFGAGAPEQQMVIAVFVTWGSIVLGRSYAALFYVLDEPRWLSLSPMSGFVALTSAIAGMLFLTAPGITPGAVEGRYKIHMIAALCLGCLIAGFMLGVSGGYSFGVSPE